MVISRALWLCVSGLLLVACDSGGEPEELTLVESLMRDPVALQRGEALFQGTCAGLCHALEPKQSDSAYLFDCEWIHGDSDEEIFAVISTGIPDTRMVGFGDNFPEGDGDKWKLIAYLRANQQPCD
ncbi:MAG: c-type cytochrome [Gammaproteobacteria bacterium]|jgi:mono/diheme cytochrome c family protein